MVNLIRRYLEDRRVRDLSYLEQMRRVKAAPVIRQHVEPQRVVFKNLLVMRGRETKATV